MGVLIEDGEDAGVALRGLFIISPRRAVQVSVDSKFSHLAWSKMPRNKGGLGGCSYPLVADITKAISKDYGVLIEDGEDAGVALRGLFIISPEGKLRQITVNDLPVSRSVDEVLRLVTAFQYTDEHGEVCPANWKPGAKTTIDGSFKELALGDFAG